MNLRVNENEIHTVFEVSLLLKALHSLLEIAGGLVIFFINKSYIVGIILSFTQEELSEDPNDFIAHYLINNSNDFLITSQHFIALYLLSHGIIKLFLITGLLRKKLWAYPASIIVFSLFIIYQVYKYYHVPSVWLLVLTLLDAIIIFLTIHEYKYIKKHKLFKD